MHTGFSNCYNLNSCSSTSSIENTAYDFENCLGVKNCKVVANGSDNSFDTTSCCSSLTIKNPDTGALEYGYNAANAVADTATGGFNIII